MAERADPTRVEKIKPGVRRLYPWSTWADGEWWRLTQGQDYTTTTDCFRTVARNHARRHGLKLNTQATDDGIFIRFTLKTEEAK